MSGVVAFSPAFIAAHVLFISWRFINEGAVFSIVTGAQFMVGMSWEGGCFKQKLHVLQSIPNLFLLGITEFQDFFFLCVCVKHFSFFLWVIVHSVKRRGSVTRQKIKRSKRACSEVLGWTQTQDVVFTVPQASGRFK